MTPIDQESLLNRVAEMMDDAWREPGFCVPNQETYPHQWLWDSCFHALIWNRLGSDRGVSEVTNALANQSDDGFVPHMTYWDEPEGRPEYWGRTGSSSITQPPMYGHAIVELVHGDHAVPPALVEQAVDGLLHLARRPRTTSNLIPVFHPWETGCDDSARWDAWLPGADTEVAGGIGEPAMADRRRALWRAHKNELVGNLVCVEDGHAIGSPGFSVGSIGFNALVSFNARELASIHGPWQDPMHDLADELDDAVASRWDGERWLDDGLPPGGGSTDGSDTSSSAGVRTLDSMLALLVDPRVGAFDSIVSDDAFGAPFGPGGVHVAEASYDPDCYWRGPAWPQLSYLIMIAAERAGEDQIMESVANSLVAGAVRSQLAEYWNPETGAGLGATPQTWSGLAICAIDRMEGSLRPQG